MLPPAERTTRPFGTRRPAADADLPAAVSPGATDSERPAGPLAWALRISALVGVLAVFATHQLARLGHAGPAPARLALVGQTSPADPETTGSITPAGAARTTRLDPCLLPVPDRQHR